MRISDWSSDVCSSDLRPWLALAVRKEAIENLTVDGERFDLGILGPDRAVVGFRGTAILVVGGVSLKWISGCAQPSLRRLHFVGEVMRGVTGQIHVGMPAVWIEKEERFSQRRDRKSTRLKSSH